MYDSPANGSQLIIPRDAIKRTMRALFDYDPRELSPNPDIEMELPFRQGETLYVYGEMDDDGFFIVSLYVEFFSKLKEEDFSNL